MVASGLSLQQSKDVLEHPIFVCVSFSFKELGFSFSREGARKHKGESERERASEVESEREVMAGEG